MILVEEAWWDRALGVSGGLLGVDFRGLLPQLFCQVDFRVNLAVGRGLGGTSTPSGGFGILGFGGGDVWASPLPFSEAVPAAAAWHFPVCAASSVQENWFIPLGGNPPQFLVPIRQPQLLSCLRGAP